ncbi:MAG: exonuclease domain-containing protein [Anaerolineales bacterium]
MQSIVSIDIETTGLNNERDTIIEIGAVKFKGHRVEDEWSTLVNPGKHIPEFITGLTGINDSEVRNAPKLRDIAQDLEAFVGDAPVVGHNVRFDLGFLQKQAGILNYNDVIDTYELAAVLMPTASRYNLGALGKQLGILLPATHRALEDARVTMAAFNKLFEMAKEIPLETIAEIVRLCEPIEWDAGWTFQEVLKARAKEGIQAKKTKKKESLRFDDSKFPPLDNPEKPYALNVDEVASILEYGGPFSQYFQTFEQRPEQIGMIRAVTNALSYGSHLMVEAGTGVGKSFAYLVPAALFAVQNNTRVVVSTNTINLQDQLIQRDLPNLGQALNLDYRFAVLKGRSNYLCPRRLENLRHFGPRTQDEMRVLAKVMVWQLTNTSGDRSELKSHGSDRA